MTIDGNETLAALRAWLFSDTAITDEVGDRIFQPHLPDDHDTWPAILLEDLVADPELDAAGMRYDEVQVKVIGNPRGTARPDQSQTIAKIAHLVQQRLLRASGIAAAQPRLMAVLGCRTLGEGGWDPETQQPIRRLLATVLAHDQQEAVTV